MENANLINLSQSTKPKPEPVPDDHRNKLKVPQKAASSKAARRRTKTGCLTCRQRRIKCGEEKPICKNCTKSKRECKGYAQRLIFKNPLGIPGIPNCMPTQPLQHPTQYESEIDFQLTSARTHGPILAPKLPTTSGYEQRSPPQFSSECYSQFHDADTALARQFSLPPQTLLPEPPSTYKQETPSAHLQQHRQESSNYTGDCFHYQAYEQAYFPRGNENWETSTAIDSIRHYQGIQVPNAFSAPRNPSLPIRRPEVLETVTTHGGVLSPGSPLSPFEYIDEDDDGPYDVETDEEAEEQVSMQNFNQLSMVMASANRDERQPRHFTTYLNEPNVLASYQPSFSSSPLNNPKTARIFLHFIHSTGPSLSVFERHPIDPSTMLGSPVPLGQQGLWTYTLPLKAFEHQALQQAILALSSLHIAYLQQSPTTVSLKHYQYALRRVGKAVGLPTRRKQLGTLAASLLLAYYEVMTADHTKWNNHLAGSAQLVREIDFAGVTRDLRAQRRSRLSEQSNMHGTFMHNPMFENSASSDDPFADLENDVDQNIVGCLLGRAVNYDQFGQIEVEHTGSRKRYLTRKDIETFRIQCDLYWWFCKQDWLQSIISGGALFLPYSHWGQSPPRAGMGRLDAIYGTADHLTLLMGRLADFGVRDRKRKIKATKATGSDWRPDSRFGKFMARFAPRPPGQTANPASGPPPGAPHLGGSGPQPQTPGAISGGRQQQGNTFPGSPPGNPPMYGMIPSSGPRQIPAAFIDTSPGGHDPYATNESDDGMSYEEAESEWEGILTAFEAFEKSLGSDYMPLPPDSTIPIYSPFGPAIQYRTHNIGSLWGLYYTGRILLHRLHPSMPPAMMVAAGVAAPTTAKYAQIIGKITAGIYGHQSRHVGVEGLSPTLGSCLIEVTVPLFFAAVQYMDPAQRDWVIAVLGDISRLTGWKSSDAVARGCERSWIAAAEKGRGPPYERTAQPPPSWISCAPPDANTTSNTERRFVTVSKPQYLTWALGILSLEDNI
ncbi:hypothetical protein BJX61DRAFT_22314 [Aspergillus egyptiacus]|nr:hypothetical protein BJX61DRAFT_22314 [Aspergillus egyptiacus]